MRRILWSGTGLSTALSLILAVTLAAATSLNVQMAVVVGLLSTLIGLAITAFVGLEGHINQINDARIGALPLHRLLAIPDLEGVITQLVDATAETKAAHGAFLQSLARETLEEACGRVTGISDGSVCCEAEDELRLVRRALAHTERRVSAVAARGTEWWVRPEADVYWRAYGEAAQRLDIARIFIIRDGAEAEMEHVLLRHYKLAMKTFIVRADHVPPDRIRALVVFDDKLLHRHAPRHEADPGYQVEFTDRPDDIIRAQETFNILLDLADEWKPPSEEVEDSSPATVPSKAGRGLLRRLVSWTDRGATP